MAAKKKVVKIAKTKVELKYHFLKSNGYRSVHADGFFGGVTSTGKIHMTAYAERNPIPKITHHPVVFKKDEIIGIGPEKKEKRESLDGIIREFEVGVYFDLGVARSLLTWLDDKIKTLEKGTIGESN